MNNIFEICANIKYLSSVSDNDSDWSQIRNPDLYDLVDVEYPYLGKKKIFVVKNKLLYESLQASRGISFDSNKCVEKNLAEIEKDMSKSLNDNEKQIVSEIIGFQEISGLDFSSIENYVELGFRVPRFLKLFKKAFKKNVWGFDLVDLNVLIAREFGFIAEKYDLSICDCALTLKHNTVISCYHVLEHVSDPLKALRKIKNSMGTNSYLHVEVPIEELGEPNLRIGHLFSFERGEFKKLLNACGFEEVFKCNPKSGNERFLVK